MGRIGTDHKVFRLQGLSFREELEGGKVDFKAQTVYLGLIPWETCNWACAYCHQDRKVSEAGDLTVPELVRIIDEAGALGVKSLLLLGGEVVVKTRWSDLKQLVHAAFERGLITVLYTNGSQLTSPMARWLASRNVSLALKVDSLNEETYDTLTQREGSFKSTLQAIAAACQTSIGEAVLENKREKLVRLLFTTVGNALNVDEYVSLARFATNHGARWMMEALNHRGEVVSHPELAIDGAVHSRAMNLATALNPEQAHDFSRPCRLLSCVTIRPRGEIGICPQDYNVIGNIRECGSLEAAIRLVRAHVASNGFQDHWNGACPIKRSSLAYV